MPEFLTLPPAERLEALRVAADRSARPAYLLEKDVWVVWALQQLYNSPFANSLVFKGGTSLSKAYGIIQRFSEDVDLTYDIRELIPDLVREIPDALPTTTSQQKRWTDGVNERLPRWIADEVHPYLERARGDLPITLRIEGEKLFIDYEAALTGSGYVQPSVMLEFGARSTGEPAARQEVVCDASLHLEELIFPTARPRVMTAERTFWEKATAIHVFCLGGRLPGDRRARHWYDLTRLDQHGIAARAIGDRNLADQVARHKTMFFAARAADQSRINYVTAVNGALRLVPEGTAAQSLQEDYARMIDDGLLLEEAEDFATLMNQCAEIAQRANAEALR